MLRLSLSLWYSSLSKMKAQINASNYYISLEKNIWPLPVQTTPFPPQDSAGVRGPWLWRPLLSRWLRWNGGCGHWVPSRRSVLSHGNSQMVVGALYSLARIWGERSTIHSLPAFFFFFKVEIRSNTLIPLFMPGSVHSGSASWDGCGRLIPDRLRMNSFPEKFPT